MPFFSYVGLNKDGERAHGTIEAISLQAARDSLKKTGISATELYETVPKHTAPPVSNKTTLHSNWSPTPTSTPTSKPTNKPNPTSYAPFISTLRLYAGWLLAWYALAYALGSYQWTRNLPFRIPLVEGLLLSPLVLSFTLATFLFLMFTEIHKASDKRANKYALIIVGIIAFLFYRVNV